MLEYLEIENFKSFSSNQKLKLSPITLIYGPNSSGKSSLIQAIMMLQQTILSTSKDGTLVTSGNSIGLGDFRSLVYSQDETRKIKITLRYRGTHSALEYMQKFSRKLLFANNDIREVSLQIAFNKKAYIDFYGFKCIDKNKENLVKADIGFDKVYNTSSDNDYKIRDKNYFTTVLLNRYSFINLSQAEQGRIEETVNSLFKVNSRINFPSISEGDSVVLMDYFERIVDDLEYKFHGVNYLGPLRSSPKRFYSADISNYQKGQGKKNLGLELFKSSSDTKKNINGFLTKFNVPYTVDVKNIGDYNTGELISVQLKDLRNNAIVTPKDVGFGIGQVLPIILESVVSNNKVLCIEQPEIHLHPKLQANLADLFIHSVLKNGNQWIIETHSEALMLRLQRRIREKELDKNNVSVLYVDVGESGAQVTELPLDSDGDFVVEWPNGFFEERLDEIFGKR